MPARMNNIVNYRPVSRRKTVAVCPIYAMSGCGRMICFNECEIIVNSVLYSDKKC